MRPFVIMLARCNHAGTKKPRNFDDYYVTNAAWIAVRKAPLDFPTVSLFFASVGPSPIANWSPGVFG